MWVRSQDKTVLIKCNNFSVECYTDSKTNIKSFGIETIESHNGTYTTLGSYSTKEKALKVLDMIAQAIQENECVRCTSYSGGSYKNYKVFQMPPDEDSEEARVIIKHD